ncbi:hypothetical protein AVEN_37110-1 [Araneus ventricosus]|uniref:Uncharacterized protein n=1 Tax=Araneus ventricosus TaxID=182803 RepID=A0A4Y2TI63_ARAVE|nr:hypothetical protein AVEN_37110-1 [Araneus ventricosus]
MSTCRQEFKSGQNLRQSERLFSSRSKTDDYLQFRGASYAGYNFQGIVMDELARIDNEFSKYSQAEPQSREKIGATRVRPILELEGLPSEASSDNMVLEQRNSSINTRANGSFTISRSILEGVKG